jgi:hypothetical protein
MTVKVNAIFGHCRDLWWQEWEQLEIPNPAEVCWITG